MSFGAGKNCKVTLGANKVLGMGTVALSGVDTDLLDKTEFGDDWKQWEVGLKDGGEFTFNGMYDSADATGQDVESRLDMLAKQSASIIESLRSGKTRGVLY